jgi:hypothetical protein
MAQRFIPEDFILQQDSSENLIPCKQKYTYVNFKRISDEFTRFFLGVLAF